MKQTAVEWLEKQLIGENGINVLKDVFEQAKEMEKEQIIEAGNACALMQHIHEARVSEMSIEEVEKFAEEEHLTFGEEFYNETYKK